MEALLTLGGLVAMGISYYKNKSILWALLHGLLSWAYVVYYFMMKKDNI